MISIFLSEVTHSPSHWPYKRVGTIALERQPSRKGPGIELGTGTLRSGHKPEQVLSFLSFDFLIFISSFFNSQLRWLNKKSGMGTV